MMPLTRTGLIFFPFKTAFLDKIRFSVTYALKGSAFWGKIVLKETIYVTYLVD